MIITRVAATNAFKYEKLDIRDIPTTGVIAISGDNETGKSSIGEIISFSLFGKTFSLSDGDLEKAIRWGEFNCSLSTSFTVGDGEEYEVFRFLDEDRKLGARLSRVGEDEPLATGMDSVTNAVCELVGFDFNEFLETFYLAQREIIKPHPHSEALKSIAGLSVLEQIGEELENQNDDSGVEAEELQQRISEIATELAELNIQPDRFGQLEAQRRDLEAQADSFESAARDLELAADNYHEAMEDRVSDAGSGVASLLKWLMLALAAVLGGAWFFTTQMKASAIAMSLMPIMTKNGITFDMLLIGAGGAGLLFVLFWVLGGGRGDDTEALKPVATSLASRLRAGWALQSSVAAGNGINDEAIERLTTRLVSGLASMEEAEPVISAEKSRLEGSVEATNLTLADVITQLDEERRRTEKAETIGAEKGRLDSQMQQVDHQKKVRETACRLLKGAAAHVVKRFNGDLREFAARTLPLFTGNRYEHLRVEDDLNVRVFSNRKRDFMELSEISAGTQRQIMLALRLALAKELADTAVIGSQFMFLDEPFAFFDEKRTRDTLKVLLEISERVTQVWVVNQEYADDQEFALHIRCEDEANSLIYPPPA